MCPGSTPGAGTLRWKKMIPDISKLTTILSMPALNGSAALLAAAGMFKVELAPMLAITLLVGPGTIATAVIFEGSAVERVLAAVLAGVIATVLLAAAAGLGPKLLGFLDLRLMKLFGGVAVILIGLVIMDLKVPAKAPMFVMLIGIIISIIGGVLK